MRDKVDEKIELNDDELNIVSGGILTPDAQAYWSNNEEDIISDAFTKLPGGSGPGTVDNKVNSLIADQNKVYSEAELKDEISKLGI